MAGIVANSAIVTAGTSFTVTLTEQEYAALKNIAAELASTSPGLIDDPAWMEAARQMSCRLPLRLLELTREFRRDSGRDGLLVIQNLPVYGDWLPPTPTVPESVERTATIAAATLVLVALQIGEVVAFRDEKSGALVSNVVPVIGREDTQSNAGSMTVLEMHTENAFHSSRPDFVALLCLRRDHDGRAGLCVSSIRRAVELLPEEVRQTLAEPRFITEPPPSFNGGGRMTEPHAILDGDLDDPNVHVDFTSTYSLDGKARQAMALLKEAFNEVSRILLLRPGDLAVIDNRLTIHGRTSFTPRYDGEDRWVHRSHILMDYRRSRADRPGNGHVLA